LLSTEKSRHLVNFCRKLIIPPGTQVRLDDYDPGDTLKIVQDPRTEAKLARTLKRLDHLQDVLYAEKKRALLIVLQGMDAAGKDGTIRHVMTGVTPQGCDVTAFKVPSAEELAHDYLWRVHKAMPEKGMIGVFNRSHYEDVLAVRVHKLVPKKIWKQRYDQINAFEKILSENNIKILKFFLHISKEEQKKRLEERLADPHKLWKFDDEDLVDRKYWDQYMEAYEDVFARCGTEWAPWFIIPANHKWFRNLAVSKIIQETLEDSEAETSQLPAGTAKLKPR
jgi:PPK2 family polyphosphate:nucleotide phosphotransferase